jgi:hypothetical protein
VKNKIITLILFCLLTACGKNQPDYQTLASIEKSPDTFHATAVESAPFVFGGRLLVGIWHRMNGEHDFSVYDFHTRALVATTPAHQFGSLFVDSGTLYIFGSEVRDGSSFGGNALIMKSTQDLVTWSAETEVLRAAADTKIYNTSVTRGAEGKFALAYEISKPGFQDFSFKFATSSDLVNWETDASVFSPNEYAGCPTLRYANGTYKMLYLRSRGGEYATFAASGATFAALAEKKVVFAASGNEGNNNSDVDWVEHDGRLYFTYAIGDQFTWAGIKTAVYEGTEQQFFSEVGL